jgi:oligopeptide/dipeptide ABC transporter ATP-binding protein
MALLDVSGLKVRFGGVDILRGVDFSVNAGQTLGIVGESGCGKSMTGLALMGMIPPGGEVAEGSINFDGRDLTKLSRREWLDVRGQSIAMVMQDPFTSLNPMMKVGDQVAEVYRLHAKDSWPEARAKAVEMLNRVGIPDPEAAAKKFPHQMSGGQRQRVVIATAFAARPKLLIADEPTTALDVTIQAQVLRLIKELQQEVGTAVILISHDVGVVGAMADDVAVFYAGRAVESGPAEEVLRRPAHPYTQGLLASVPVRGASRLQVLEGSPVQFGAMPPGCPFAPRCPHRHDRCIEEPDLIGGRSACWLQSSAEA